MKAKSITIALFSAICLVSCASMDSTLTGNNTMPEENKRKEIVEKFKDLNPSQKEQFIQGNPWTGMSQQQLEALWGGPPKRSQKKLSEAGAEEIQIYGVRVGNWETGVKTKYYKVHMKAGKLSEMQELDEKIGNFDKL